MAKHTAKPQGSSREREYTAMLKEALARPGVWEVMQVYQNYQKADKGLEPYRLVTKRPEVVITTDHANLHHSGLDSRPVSERGVTFFRGSDFS